MSTVNSTGDLSTILAVDPFSVNLALDAGFTFFDLHAFIAFDDFYYLDYVAVIDTPTYIEAFLNFANGDAIFTGTNMDLVVGVVNTIDFVGDGGSFSFAGQLDYSFGTIDKWTFTSVSAMDGTEGFLMEGANLRLAPNGGMHGTATRQVTYTNGIEIEYIGSFGAGTQKGFYTNINVTDPSGSFSLAGKFMKSEVTTATFVCFTFDEFLDYAPLFKGSDTYTLTDGMRDWHGFDGNDKMYGGAAADTLSGDAGNDTLDGGGGNDILTGGAGNDLYFIDSGADTIVELAAGGTDTVSTGVSFDLSLALNTENLVLTGGGNIDATGNDGRNTLTGNGGDNRIDGGLGADNMAGGAGNDTFVVDNTGDKITDTFGSDTVESSVNFTLGLGLENLELYGAALRGTGNTAGNSITGNANANTLSGLGGDDILDGGIGSDTLTGGVGADIFTFSATDGASDTVTDFNRLQGDKIDISDLLTGFDPLADDITQFVRIDTVGTGSVLFVDADGGGDSFVQIATLTRATGLTDEDALLTAGVLIAG